MKNNSLFFLLAIISFFFVNIVKAQQYNETSFRKVDSLVLNAEPRSAQKLVEEIYNYANHHDSVALSVKASIYRMLFQSYLEEDAIYSILIELNADIKKAQQPQKSILQSVLASVYSSYLNQNRYKIVNRTALEDSTNDGIETWTVARVNQEISNNYWLSIKEAKLLQKIKIATIGILIQGNWENRLYRPTLYDLLVHRVLDALPNLYVEQEVKNRDILFFNKLLNGDELFDWSIIPSDSISHNLQLLKIYKNLMDFHQASGNIHALADIKLKCLKFIFREAKSKDYMLYDNKLSQLADEVKGTAIYADILYERAELRRGKIIKGKTGLNDAVKLAEKAIKAYPESIGAQNSKMLITRIKAKNLRFSIRAKPIVGREIPVFINYTNVDTIQVNIYKVSIQLKNSRLNYEEYFKGKTPFRSVKIVLPPANDYQPHTYIDKIEGLPIGSYMISTVVTDNDGENKLIDYTPITVSNILAVYRQFEDKLLYKVINVVDGSPIVGARVKQGKFAVSTELVDYNNISNQHGLVSLAMKHDNRYALISFQNDSVMINIQSGRYIKDEQRKKVVFFTDRAIYRPGQMIYYKGILLSTIDNKNEILPNEKVKISFKNVNWKDIKTVDLTSNEFGSFQGSFAVPAGILNGTMRIVSEYGSIDVQVEEYKRPTFEVVFDKTDQKYKLNDSIKVKGKVLSLAGYAMGNASVKYNVILSNLPYIGENYRNIDTSMEIIANGTTNTKAGGDFEIGFIPEVADTKQNYILTVKAEITANNGETRANTTQIKVGYKDIVAAALFSKNIVLKEKPDTLTYQVTNLNGQPIKATVKTEWKLLKSPKRLANHFEKAEKYGLSRQEFIKAFPFDEYNDENNIEKWAVAKTVLTKRITADATGLAHLVLNEKDLPTGYYRVKSTMINALNDTLVQETTVRVYNHKPERIILPEEWLFVEKSVIQPNEKAKFRLAGLTPNSKVYYEIYYQNRLEKQAWINVSPQQTIVEFAPKPYYKDSFVIQFFMVCDGTVYTTSSSVTINDPKQQLDIRFLSFRDKLQPGEKETWKLKINNKAGEKELAEMVATLYDASLDSFRPLRWQEKLTYPYQYRNYEWIYNNDNFNSTSIFNYFNRHSFAARRYEQLNLFGFTGIHSYSYNGYLRVINRQRLKDRRLAELVQSKFIYGVVLDNMMPIQGLEVKVVGRPEVVTDANGIYGIEAKEGEELTFSSIGYYTKKIIVGKNRRIDVMMYGAGNYLNEITVSGYSDRTKEVSVGSSFRLYDQNLQAVPVANVTDMLQGKVAGLNIQQNIGALDMGARIPIGGSYEFSNQKIAIRSDFSETAFFYPQLKTNEKGEIDLSFTVPQSLTRFTMRGFAYTKDLKTASITNQLITQKQFAVSLNTPRFYREADTIWLSATVNNLSGKTLKGNVVLALKNTLTGNTIQLSQTPQLIQFKIDDNGSETLKWQLVIPPNIGALTCKVMAEAGKYTDGEEITIPVLPNRILMTESMPFNVRGNSSKTFEMAKLIKSGSSNTLQTQSLTLEFTANPAWYAVQALPYLIEYPYECAEQTFSRFFANSFATGIVNSSPQIKQVFEQWQQAESGEALLSNLEKNSELKTILLEETPWVRQAENETDRKKRIATLFDLNRMSYELKGNFDKLAQMQLSNGAFPWFAGMSENRYITQHILMGFGKLQKADLINEKELVNYKSLVNKAIIYLDNELIADYKKELKNKGSDHLALHYLLARSYFNHHNSSLDFKLAFMYYFRKIKANWITMDTYQQAQAALVLMRNGEKETALKIIALLKQTAQHKEEMGMYWPTNYRGWWWYQNPVETQALLIIAFDEVANDQKAVEQMKIWLLKNKQTNDWKNTKTTAEACYALLMKGENLLQDNHPLTIALGNVEASQFKQPNSAAEAGTGYEKINIPAAAVKPEMGKIVVRNDNKGIAWGALYWQYFEQLDKITPSNTGIKIEKQLFLQKETEKGKLLTTLNDLKVGDLVKVRIVIKADRDMEYLHLKDMRSAGFEPVNVISSYKFQDGLGYYESTKDAATNFFISYMPKGTYVFEYPLRVTHAGSFSNGITSMQSMYAPEFTTYSQGIRVNVK